MPRALSGAWTARVVGVVTLVPVLSVSAGVAVGVAQPEPVATTVQPTPERAPEPELVPTPAPPPAEPRAEPPAQAPAPQPAQQPAQQPAAVRTSSPQQPAPARTATPSPVRPPPATLLERVPASPRATVTGTTLPLPIRTLTREEQADVEPTRQDADQGTSADPVTRWVQLAVGAAVLLGVGGGVGLYLTREGR